jgi:glutaredoxin
MSTYVRTKTPARSWLSLAVVMVVVVGGSQSLAWWHGRQSAQEVRALAQEGDITMFTTSTCQYCAQAKSWLSTHDVPWRECNVETDARCLAQFNARGAPGVPLMSVRGRWQLGFDPAWLASALQPNNPNKDASPRP